MTLPRTVSRMAQSPLDDLAAGLTRLADAKRPMAALLLSVVLLVAGWFVYVPIHELLHAGGCMLAGGTVTELQIAPQYGGTLLARWFPFVVAGGEYAGRLSGFDWKGSDLIYLVTDFAPYVLTVLFGVPMMRMCGRRRRPILFGLAIVVGLAPFYNVFGDYYEMGSIILTRVITVVSGSEELIFAGLRSDDVFKLAGELFTKPDSLGLASTAQIVGASVLALGSFVLGIVLAIATYVVGHALARAMVGPVDSWQSTTANPRGPSAP